MTDALGPYDQAATAVIRAQFKATPIVSPAFVLTVVDGPDVGKSFRVDDGAGRRVLVGQSPVCEVRLSDKTVSRRHVALEVEGAALRIVDQGSSNGTSVSGVRVRDAYLRNGELVVIGSTTLRVDLESSPRPVAASNETHFGQTLGASPEMRRLYPVFERLAASNVPVLIEGETGTGKEVLAESLHAASERAKGPFVVFDCTTVSAQLVEAELFGHERGAFTGAVAERAGLFEEADGGTIFIDEIGDLDITLQAKLLRAIERGEIKRVGGSKWTKVDTRIVAATRRDLDQEVQARRFRDDLFFRLAVARVELPPLRSRQGDVALLTRCFWKMLGGKDGDLPPDLLQRFEGYAWPGNVRELHNAVARQLALGDVLLGRESATKAAPGADFIEEVLASETVLPRARQKVTLELERRFVAKMLEVHGGNVSRAAAACGISRRYFQMLRAKK